MPEIEVPAYKCVCDPESASGEAAGHPSGLSACRTGRVTGGLRRRILIEIGVLGALAAGYTGYQRIGTVANADRVEFTPNLSGGFMALGMTSDQPGVLVLSAMDRGAVDVRAVQSVNPLAGRSTTVTVETPTGRWSRRLRGPEVVLINEAGAVDAVAVDWPLSDFASIREQTDCSYASKTHRARCGRPFADLQEMLATWPAGRVPRAVSTFLTPYAASSKRVLR